MNRRPPKLWIVRLVVLVTLGTTLPICAAAAERSAKPAAEKAPEKPAEQFEFLRDGQTKRVVGRVVIEAADGGVLLDSADGVLWSIERGEQQHRDKLNEPFKPFTATALSEKLIAEMP